jgi:hypothetical protein
MEYQWEEVIPVGNGQTPGVPLLTALGCWQQIPVGFQHHCASCIQFWIFFTVTFNSLVNYVPNLLQGGWGGDGRMIFICGVLIFLFLFQFSVLIVYKVICFWRLSYIVFTSAWCDWFSWAPVNLFWCFTLSLQFQ